jgi:hypothetical protein
VQRRVERIPTDSQWAFRMGNTPPTRVMPAGDEPLAGPAPPRIPPLDEEEK